MVCLRNMCVDTLHKGDNDDNNNNNNNNNNGSKIIIIIIKCSLNVFSPNTLRQFMVERQALKSCRLYTDVPLLKLRLKRRHFCRQKELLTQRSRMSCSHKTIKFEVKSLQYLRQSRKLRAVIPNAYSVHLVHIMIAFAVMWL